MSAREEIIEIVARDPESSGGDGIWATDLADAHAREVADEIIAEVERISGVGPYAYGIIEVAKQAAISALNKGQ